MRPRFLTLVKSYEKIDTMPERIYTCRKMITVGKMIFLLLSLLGFALLRICTCSLPTGHFFPKVALSHCRVSRQIFLPRAFGAPCSIFW